MSGNRELRFRHNEHVRGGTVPIDRLMQSARRLSGMGRYIALHYVTTLLEDGVSYHWLILVRSVRLVSNYVHMLRRVQTHVYRIILQTMCVIFSNCRNATLTLQNVNVSDRVLGNSARLPIVV